MKKRIIITAVTAAITLSRPVCRRVAAGRNGRENTHAERNDRRDHSGRHFRKQRNRCCQW